MIKTPVELDYIIYDTQNVYIGIINITNNVSHCISLTIAIGLVPNDSIYNSNRSSSGCISAVYLSNYQDYDRIAKLFNRTIIKNKTVEEELFGIILTISEIGEKKYQVQQEFVEGYLSTLASPISYEDFVDEIKYETSEGIQFLCSYMRYLNGLYDDFRRVVDRLILLPYKCTNNTIDDVVTRIVLFSQHGIDKLNELVINELEAALNTIHRNKVICAADFNEKYTNYIVLAMQIVKTGGIATNERLMVI